MKIILIALLLTSCISVKTNADRSTVEKRRYASTIDIGPQHWSGDTLYIGPIDTTQWWKRKTRK